MTYSYAQTVTPLPCVTRSRGSNHGKKKKARDIERAIETNVFWAAIEGYHESSSAPNPSQPASASPLPGLLPDTDPSPPAPPEQQQPAPPINRRLTFDAEQQLEESPLSPSTPPGFTDSPGENGTISCCCMLTAHMKSWKDTRNVVVA